MDNIDGQPSTPTTWFLSHKLDYEILEATVLSLRIDKFLLESKLQSYKESANRETSASALGESHGLEINVKQEVKETSSSSSTPSDTRSVEWPGKAQETSGLLCNNDPETENLSDHVKQEKGEEPENPDHDDLHE